MSTSKSTIIWSTSSPFALYTPACKLEAPSAIESILATQNEPVSISTSGTLKTEANNGSKFPPRYTPFSSGLPSKGLVNLKTLRKNIFCSLLISFCGIAFAIAVPSMGWPAKAAAISGATSGEPRSAPMAACKSGVNNASMIPRCAN